MRSSLIYSNIIHFGIISMVFYFIHAFWYHFIYRGALWWCFWFLWPSIGFSDNCLPLVLRSFISSWIGVFNGSEWDNWMATSWMKVIAWCLKISTRCIPTLTSKLNYYFFCSSLSLLRTIGSGYDIHFRLHVIFCWKDNKINIDVERVFM